MEKKVLILKKKSTNRINPHRCSAQRRVCVLLGYRGHEPFPSPPSSFLWPTLASATHSASVNTANMNSLPTSQEQKE
jgi:hypothetical protein